MDWPLTTTFLIGALISFLTAGIIYGALHRLRTSGSKPAAGWDLSIYILFVFGIFFLSGAALEKFVPEYHRHLVDAKYLVISPESTSSPGASKAQDTSVSQEKKADGIGAGELMTLLGILTGIPVAFAGSIYAILLARRADHTATEQMEGDFENRLDEITGKITANFTRFADRLLEVNASAGSVFERAYALINPLMFGSASTISLQQCADIIEREELPRLKLAIKDLRDCVADIQRHSFSTEVLRLSLKDSRSTLAASFFANPDNYRQPKPPLAWLRYCEPECANLVDPLELLRVQVSRLNGMDVLAGILEVAMISAANTALEHLDISDQRVDFDELFLSSWLNQGTRGKEEIYFCRGLGRILCTRELQRNSKIETVRMINIGAVILEDLYRLVPTKDHIMRIVKDKGVGLRLYKLNTKLVDDHFNSISYAGNALFPSYFIEGAAESLKPNSLAGGDSALVLRLPEYSKRIYALVRNEMEQPGNLSAGFKEVLRDYLCDSIIDASLFSSGSVAGNLGVAIGDPNRNAMAIADHPSLEKRIETLRALSMLAFAHLSLGESDKYSFLAQEAALGNPALLQQCNLDEGDFAWMADSSDRALQAYSLAFEDGRPGNPAQLSTWLEGLLRKLSYTLYIQGAVLTSNEVAAEDGMLPLLCGFIFQPADIAYRVDKKALCEARTEFVGGFICPDCFHLATAVKAFLESLPANGDKGYQLDAAYETWFARVQKLEFAILPPANMA